MDTTVNVISKKKFSVGSIFCFVTAIAMGLFGITRILSQIASFFSFIINVIFMPEGSYYGTELYIRLGIQNLVNGIFTSGAYLVWIVSAVALIALGVFLMFKISSKWLIILSVIQVALSLLSACAHALRIMFGVVMVLFQVGNPSLQLIVDTVKRVLLRDTISVFPFVCMALCWALFILVTALAKSKPSAEKKPTTIPALIVAAAFGITPWSFLVSALWGPLFNLLTTGVGLNNVLTFMNVMDWVGIFLFSLILSVLFAITFFLVTKWLCDPYKSVSVETQQ